jgi:phosphohistidine swiveling domain-containing protein
MISHLLIGGMLDKRATKEIFDLDTLVRWLQVNYFFYQFNNDLKKQEEEIKDRFSSKGLDYVSELVKKCMVFGNELQEKCKELSAKSLLTENREDLANLMEEFFDVERKYTVFYNITQFEGPATDIAKNLVKKYSKNEKEFEELLSAISVSNKDTVVEEEQKDFLVLASSDVLDKEELADKHAKQYGWISLRFFLGEPWRTEDILNRLSNISKEEAKNELEKRLNKRLEKEEKIKVLTKDFSVDDKKVVDKIREIIFVRNQRADFFHESGYHIRPLLLKVAISLNVSYNEVLNLCVPEIVLALRGKLDYKKHIEERKKNFLVYYGLGGPFILEGDNVKKFIERNSFLKRSGDNLEELKGNIAYKGLATGVVRILKTDIDNKKVKRGDVVVAPMTIPSFMPALEKAVAFVTDEGGITCHASIVAREMHKPCIIGTKIATKVLKDGDLVEVDANRGVVKIIRNLS